MQGSQAGAARPKGCPLVPNAKSPRGLSGTGHVRTWEGARWRWWAPQASVQLQAECQRDSEQRGSSTHGVTATTAWSMVSFGSSPRETPENPWWEKEHSQEPQGHASPTRGVPLRQGL